MGEIAKWRLLAVLDIVGSSGFDYEFRALESASISDSINSKEKSGPELVDAYNTVFGTGSPPRVAGTLPMIFPFRFVQPLRLGGLRRRECGAEIHAAFPIGLQTAIT